MTDFNLSEFEAIIFDLDSTLVDTKRYQLKASEWTLSRCVPEPSAVLETFVRELLWTYYSDIDKVLKGAPYRSPYDIVRGAIQSSLKSLGVKVGRSFLDESTDFFKRLHIELSTTYPGVESLLERLKANEVKMGVITNSFDGHVRAIIEKLGFSRFFDVLVESADVKAYKPMREPFEHALRGLKMQPVDTLYVGDEYYADVVGAWHVGMKAVWVNVRGVSLEESLAKYGSETAPVLVVNSMSELAAFL